MKNEYVNKEVHADGGDHVKKSLLYTLAVRRWEERCWDMHFGSFACEDFEEFQVIAQLNKI